MGASVFDSAGGFVVVFCFFFGVVFGAGFFVVFGAGFFVVVVGLTVVYRIQIFVCLFHHICSESFELLIFLIHQNHKSNSIFFEVFPALCH